MGLVTGATATGFTLMGLGIGLAVGTGLAVAAHTALAVTGDRK